MQAATGPNRSRPWNDADNIGGRHTTRQTCVRVARPAITDSKPFGRSGEPLAVRLHDHHVASRPDLGVHDGQKNSSDRKPSLQGSEQMRARSQLEILHAVQQVDDRRVDAQVLQEGSLDLRDIDVIGAEIGEEGNHGRSRAEAANDYTDMVFAIPPRRAIRRNQ